MASSSPPPVNTNCPFLPLIIAVPVSWHMGKTPPAAMLAFFSRSRATNRSLSLASGSTMMLASCCKWLARSRCAMSRMACSVSLMIAAGSTLRNVPSLVSKVETPSFPKKRYCVSSAPRGSSSENSKGAGVGLAITRVPVCPCRYLDHQQQELTDATTSLCRQCS